MALQKRKYEHSWLSVQGLWPHTSWHCLKTRMSPYNGKESEGSTSLQEKGTLPSSRGHSRMSVSAGVTLVLPRTLQDLPNWYDLSEAGS